MTTPNAKSFISELLNPAGININGPHPWDFQVSNENFYGRVLKEGALGLGEAYMDEWWDCPNLDQFFERVIRADLETKITTNARLFLEMLLLRVVNQQSMSRALVVGKQHYDLGNELFKYMLDSRMLYSCGYWKYANNLEEAQLHKLELCCQKLMLKPGMRLLDIGCGFGSLAKYAAENFGVEVVGITISQQQYDFATKNCEGLPVEIRFQDYRNVDEKFDRIVSVGMFEHVGHLNYRRYMKMASRCLKDDGLFLLHTIGVNKTNLVNDRWVAKYIFPNYILPSIAQIAKASEGALVMEDWHNFGADYDKTLMAWHHNFNHHWKHLKENYDERFFRMWNYYLLSCAGSFRARSTQVWQIVFSKNGVPGGYVVVRPTFTKK